MFLNMLNRGFAFIPFLVIVGVFVFGAATTAVVMRHLNSDKINETVEPVSAERDSIDELVIDTQGITTTTLSEIKAKTTVEEVEVVLDEIPVAKSASKLVERDYTEEIVTDVKPVVAGAKPIVKAEVEDMSAVYIKEKTYNQVKTESESVKVILDEIKEIIDSKKTAKEKEIAFCKDNYDYEVERIESRWVSDMKAYEQQNSWYESNKGLYEITGTATNNSESLQEKFNESKNNRDAGLESAKFKYESCKNSNKWATSFDKDVTKLVAEQKYIMKTLTSDTAHECLTDMQNLINKAEKFKYSLLFSF